MERVGPRRLAVLLRELHFAAQYVPGDPGPERGLLFERLIADRLAAEGFPVQAVAPGVRIVGALPVSGIGHQFDAEIRCAQAEVIGEWKAYSGSVPKSELMVFKEKSEDVYMSLVGRRRRQPLFRVFGMAGDAPDKLRLYAARYGISLVERSRWPAAVLADVKLSWPDDFAPADHELRVLRYLARPLHRVYGQTADGRLVTPRPLDRRSGEILLRTHDAVSDRLDEVVGCGRDSQGGGVSECPQCGAELGPWEDESGCLSCVDDDEDLVTVADRAIAVLEKAEQPLYAHDVHREIERRWHEPTNPGSVLSTLGGDWRACWGGPKLYGLYRHGLLPGVRELGAVGSVYRHAANEFLSVDKLRFVMRDVGYRFAANSLSLAMNNYQWRGQSAWNWRTSERASLERQRAAARILRLGRRGPLLYEIMARAAKQVETAIAERERRIGRLTLAPSDETQADTREPSRPRLNSQERFERFERKLQDVALAWRERGIKTQGIVGGAATDRVKRVAGWINAPGSRPRFDEALQKLGKEWTVEALVLEDSFRSLFEGRYGVLKKAEGRLSGTVRD